MTDPNATLPPIGARTPRNMGRWLLAWAKAHPEAVAIGAGLLLAFFAGLWAGS